jgi:adenylate cyclase
MEQDEAGTFDRLQAHRNELFEPEIARHHGRIFKLMGDGLLAEFGSVVDAVECAIHLQGAMVERSKGFAANKRINLRIGINLGDVIVDGEDRQGEGVNVAARLQQVADPGGILISRTTYDHVRNKLKCSFEDLGEQRLKNLTEPVRLYRVATEWASPESVSQSPILILPLPERPSIAVLPFTNLSGNPEQQYFSDGITEEIIAELSRFRQLFVIARHSSFQFRDSAADVKRVGRELGVRYVVEGSLKRFGEQLRISAQLIDATDGAHLWAERYDRSATDVFAIQDEVVQAIVRTFVDRLEFAATERAKRRPTNSLVAYDCFLRAHDHMWRVYYDTEAYYREGTADARRMCDRAIQLDPSYAQAHACLGIINLFDWMYGGRAEDLDRAADCARTAVGLDDHDDYCHAAFGSIQQKRGEHDLAEFHLRRAVALNPNDADTICYMGIYLVYAGQPLQAIEWFESAMRRNPFCPDLYLESLSMAQYLSRRFEDGVASLRRMRKLTSWGRAYLAACYAQLGRLDAARAEIAQYVREVRPTAGTCSRDDIRLNTKIVALIADLRSHKNPADFELWIDGLRKAGLPV